MKKGFFTFILGILYASSLMAQTGLKISEVMYNPDTLEYYCEFIEIYNCSSDSLPIGGLGLRVNGIYDSLVSVNRFQSIAPGRFGLILDRGYVEKDLQIYPLDSTSIPLLTTTDQAFGKSGLPNAKEGTIVLLYRGTPIDSMKYRPDNQEGYSDEKIMVCDEMETGNWEPSRIFRGTPGRENSVVPQLTDIALDSVGEYLADSLCLIIRNNGLLSYHSTISVEIDYLQPDSVPLYTFSTRISIDLDKQEKIRIRLLLHDHPQGTVCTRIRLQTDDENPFNDEKTAWIPFPVSKGNLIINECMIQSDETGEWIELWNHSNDPVSIKDLILVDQKDTTVLPYAILSSGEFLILCETMDGHSFFQSLGIHSVQVKKWLTLNNDEDHLKVIYQNGTIDSMRYNLKERGLVLKKGTSLERVDIRRDGFDIWNWGWSTDQSGHTAGKKNSLFFQDKVSDQEVDFSPNPFSPDNDGFEDVCFFTFSFPFPLMDLDIYIFSLDGYLQKTFHFKNIPGNYVLAYDGSGKNGAKLYIGAYIVQIVATDIQSGRQKKVKKVLVSAGK
jgi:hypothetical protein